MVAEVAVVGQEVVAGKVPEAGLRKEVESGEERAGAAQGHLCYHYCGSH